MALAAYSIQIIESERGWGPRIDDEMYFLEEKDAIEWSQAYNKKFNPPSNIAPDWYMLAVEHPILVPITTSQYLALEDNNGKMYLSNLKELKKEK